MAVLKFIAAPAPMQTKVREQFFRDLAEAERNGTLGPEAYAAASEQAGITWL
jgi:hypothetical protein